jgi:hypothetical protein
VVLSALSVAASPVESIREGGEWLKVKAAERAVSGIQLSMSAATYLDACSVAAGQETRSLATDIWA